MSRHQENSNDRKKGTAARQGGFKKPSTSRGNAPIRNKAKATEKTENKVAKKPNQAPKTPKNPDELRLNKYISNSGICSRRDADIYIQSGNVKVNGIVVTEMGHRVKLTDEVIFDGVKLKFSDREKSYLSN